MSLFQPKTYSPEAFDEGYYERGERGGLRNYAWQNREQQIQLHLKLECCGTDYRSILFVGCGKGYEVRYFYIMGKDAYGVDVSSYAIHHCDPEIVGRVTLFDGETIERPDSSVDLVAAFDVLTLVPDGMREKLCAEMVRVASKKIVIRTVIKNFHNMDQTWAGMDGVSYKYQHLHEWDRLFNQACKFRFEGAKVHPRYEAVITWVRT